MQVKVEREWIDGRLSNRGVTCQMLSNGKAKKIKFVNILFP